MTLVRRRILSMMGDECYVDIYWDSPMVVEDEAGNVSLQDPGASYLIHQVFWANVSTTRTYRLTLRHKTAPFERTITPNTPETSHTFPTGQRPDMRDLSGITMVSI
jgi:hypothetical protein